MTADQIVGRILEVRRLRNSPAGGPRYELVIDTTPDGRIGTRVLRTAANTTASYGWSPHRLEGRRVTLHLNKRGTVDDIT